jgi:hypothetical protein
MKQELWNLMFKRYKYPLGINTKFEHEIKLRTSKRCQVYEKNLLISFEVLELYLSG